MTRPARHAARVTIGALALLATACAGPRAATLGPGKVEIPAYDASRARASGARASSRQAPPSEGASRDVPFPAVRRSKLASGMGVDVVTSGVLPAVEVRLVVRAGAGDGASPAVATLTGRMLVDGGTRSSTSAELLRRVETLGADLSVRTDLDATVLSLAVMKDRLAEALAIVAQLVREPRFDADALRNLEARARDVAADAAHTSNSFVATRLVFRELFPSQSPYAAVGLLPSEIAKVDAATIRDFHRRFYTPKAATLVLAGDIDEPTARALADRAFGGWAGGEPPGLAPAPPRRAGERHVVIAHRARSARSDVYVAMLAPARDAEGWPAVRLAEQILEASLAARLASDAREPREPPRERRASARIVELARGEQPLVLHAEADTDETARVLGRLLDAARAIASAPPTTSETDRARRALCDGFALRIATLGSISDLVVAQEVFGLPDGYWDTYRKRARAAEPGDVHAAAKRLYPQAGPARPAGQDGPDGAVVVVAGDADAIAPGLAKYGDVTVVDPDKELEKMRSAGQVSK